MSQRPPELGAEISKRLVHGSASSHDHVIELGPGQCRIQIAHDRLQAAPHAVSNDGTADFLGHGESEPGLAGSSSLASFAIPIRSARTRLALDQERRRASLSPATYALEFA